MVFALVTSVSSLAMPAIHGASPIQDVQELTPTPVEAPVSEAGSTDGIVWMGFVITAIVLIPLLATRAVWQKQA